MITTPNAELERLTYEIMRWTGDAYATAKTKAQTAITTLLAGTELIPIVHHPLTKWVSDHFIVHWPVASAAVNGILAGAAQINFPDASLFVGSNGANMRGYVAGSYGSLTPDQTTQGDTMVRLTCNNANGNVRFRVNGIYPQDSFTSLEIVGVGTLLAADAVYTNPMGDSLWVWDNTGFTLNEGDTYAVEFT